MEPVPGHAGAHGVFDDRPEPHSLELNMKQPRPCLFAAGVALTPRR